jgi:hypothetical protein
VKDFKISPVEILNDRVIAENHALLESESQVASAASCLVHNLYLFRSGELRGPLDLPDWSGLASLSSRIWVSPCYLNFSRHFLCPLLCLKHHVLDHPFVLLALVDHYRLVLLPDYLLPILAHTDLFLNAYRLHLIA